MTLAIGRPRTHSARVHAVLERYVSPISSRAVVRVALSRRGISARELDAQGLDEQLVREIVGALRFYCSDALVRQKASEELSALGTRAPTARERRVVEINEEPDIVAARSAARDLAQSLGFSRTEQIKIATVVSELARNICRYAGHGRVTCAPRDDPPGISIVAEDRGPGIPNLDEILGGTYDSSTGLGLGLVGCKRLMDEFSIETRPGEGTTITVAKHART